MKKKEEPFAELSEISELPESIDVSDINIIKKKCIDNSLMLAKKYPEIKLIEGVVFLVSSDESFMAIAHMWNEIENIQIDITSKLWNSEEYKEVVDVKYFKTIEYSLNEFEKLIKGYHFDDYTINQVKIMNTH